MAYEVREQFVLRASSFNSRCDGNEIARGRNVKQAPPPPPPFRNPCHCRNNKTKIKGNFCTEGWVFTKDICSTLNKRIPAMHARDIEKVQEEGENNEKWSERKTAPPTFPFPGALFMQSRRVQIVRKFASFEGGTPSRPRDPNCWFSSFVVLFILFLAFLPTVSVSGRSRLQENAFPYGVALWKGVVVRAEKQFFLLLFFSYISAQTLWL